MSDDKVEVTETITFNADGSSRHVLTLADGSVLSDEMYAVSPVMFRKSGPEFGFDTANERGIARIKQTTQRPFHSLSRNEDTDAVRPAPQFVHPAFPYENPRTPAETEAMLNHMADVHLTPTAEKGK